MDERRKSLPVYFIGRFRVTTTPRERTRLMAKGKCLGAFAMSEPNAGSDVANVVVVLRRR